jgi:glycosyltransferase involved in cell wall biosynthesis
MPALDIFSLTSAFGEGFPNVVGEAMACGVPCVVTDVGDAGFLVGDTGRAVPPKNPELLAEQWLEVISMGRERRLEMGAASRERIKARFNLRSVVSQYQRCYEELAGQPVAVGAGGPLNP